MTEKADVDRRRAERQGREGVQPARSDEREERERGFGEDPRRAAKVLCSLSLASRPSQPAARFQDPTLAWPPPPACSADAGGPDVPGLPSLAVRSSPEPETRSEGRAKTPAEAASLPAKIACPCRRAFSSLAHEANPRGPAGLEPMDGAKRKRALTLSDTSGLGSLRGHCCTTGVGRAPEEEGTRRARRARHGHQGTTAGGAEREGEQTGSAGHAGGGTEGAGRR